MEYKILFYVKVKYEENGEELTVVGKCREVLDFVPSVGMLLGDFLVDNVTYTQGEKSNFFKVYLWFPFAKDVYKNRELAERAMEKMEAFYPFDGEWVYN